VSQGRAQGLRGGPRERLHVLLATDVSISPMADGWACRRRAWTSPASALVHRDQAGVRTGASGQLRGQAGHPRIQQPVSARRADLGGMRERRGQLVAVGGQVDAVESGRPDEPAARKAGESVTPASARPDASSRAAAAPRDVARTGPATRKETGAWSMRGGRAGSPSIARSRASTAA